MKMEAKIINGKLTVNGNKYSEMNLEEKMFLSLYINNKKNLLNF